MGAAGARGGAHMRETIASTHSWRSQLQKRQHSLPAFRSVDLNVLGSQLDSQSPDFKVSLTHAVEMSHSLTQPHLPPFPQANAEAMETLVQDLRSKVERVKAGGGQRLQDLQKKRGKMTVRERIDALIDSGYVSVAVVCVPSPAVAMLLAFTTHS